MVNRMHDQNIYKDFGHLCVWLFIFVIYSNVNNILSDKTSTGRLFRRE